MAHFFSSYIAAVGGAGIDTEDILVGRRLLPTVAARAAERVGKSAPVWVLSDGNTEQAAGATLRAALADAGLEVTGPVLPAAPKPEPNLQLCDDLVPTASGASLLIAVGGGTISDIVKKVSSDLETPNWCVATAPSVDAFTSAKSALRIRGYHRTPFVRPSSLVVGDLDVLEAAPRRLLFAGAGDLLAKYFAYLDWTIAGWVTGEEYDETDARFAWDSASTAVEAVRSSGGFTPAAVENLTDAAITSGLIMQKRRNSRAAASSEHTIAHFWEVSHAVAKEELDLHGILVGEASLIVYWAYSWILDRFRTHSLPLQDLKARYRSRPPWAETVAKTMLVYRGKMEEEMAGRDFSAETYDRRLFLIESRRNDIVSLAESVLPEIGRGLSSLENAGFPFGFDTLALSSERVIEAMSAVRFLRNRYGLFDLAADLELFDPMVADLAARLTEFR